MFLPFLKPDKYQLKYSRVGSNNFQFFEAQPQLRYIMESFVQDLSEKAWLIRK